MEKICFLLSLVAGGTCAYGGIIIQRSSRPWDIRNRFKITISKLFSKSLKRLGIFKTNDRVILEPILRYNSSFRP